jgi:hypothetical protein
MNGFTELREGKTTTVLLFLTYICTTWYLPMQLFPTCQTPQQTLNSLSLSLHVRPTRSTTFVAHNFHSFSIAELTTTMVVLSEYVGNLGDDEHGQVHLITVFVAVLCLCLIIGHWLEENRWVNESITAIFTVISLSHSHISGILCNQLTCCIIWLNLIVVR